MGRDLTGLGRERVDRLPILAAGHHVVKLLSVPKLRDGTTATISQAIVQTIDEWGIRDCIRGLSFDTTASNSGHKGGVCIRLESQIGRNLLNVVCRHHISEILLQKVFSLHDVSRSPDMEVFSHFRDFWPHVDQAAFCTAMDDENTASVIAPWKDSMIEFAATQLTMSQPLDDFRELLELR